MYYTSHPAIPGSSVTSRPCVKMGLTVIWKYGGSAKHNRIRPRCGQSRRNFTPTRTLRRDMKNDWSKKWCKYMILLRKQHNYWQGNWKKTEKLSDITDKFLLYLKISCIYSSSDNRTIMGNKIESYRISSWKRQDHQNRDNKSNYSRPKITSKHILKNTQIFEHIL